jgi:hypothetical protein
LVPGVAVEMGRERRRIPRGGGLFGIRLFSPVIVLRAVSAAACDANLCMYTNCSTPSCVAPLFFSDKVQYAAWAGEPCRCNPKLWNGCVWPQRIPPEIKRICAAAAQDRLW